jgi:hypothetical protein
MLTTPGLSVYRVIQGHENPKVACVLLQVVERIDLNDPTLQHVMMACLPGNFPDAVRLNRRSSLR